MKAQLVCERKKNTWESFRTPVTLTIKQEELKESASLRLPSNNRENEKKKKFQTHGCPPSETGQQAAAHLTSYRRYIFNPERCFPLTLNLLRRPSSFVLVDGRYGSKSGGVSFGKFSQSIPKRGLNNRFSELKLWEMSDRQLREFMFASWRWELNKWKFLIKQSYKL